MVVHWVKNPHIVEKCFIKLKNTHNSDCADTFWSTLEVVYKVTLYSVVLFLVVVFLQL